MGGIIRTDIGDAGGVERETPESISRQWTRGASPTSIPSRPGVRRLRSRPRSPTNHRRIDSSSGVHLRLQLRQRRGEAVALLLLCQHIRLTAAASADWRREHRQRPLQRVRRRYTSSASRAATAWRSAPSGRAPCRGTSASAGRCPPRRSPSRAATPATPAPPRPAPPRAGPSGPPAGPAAARSTAASSCPRTGLDR